jgi:uncharacterized membrane protein
MKRQILMFTVLISNIAFSAVLPADIREVSEIREVNTNKSRVSINSAATAHLHDKGLDKEIAKQRVLKHLKHDEYANNLMAENIIKNLTGLRHKDVVSYIGNCALFQKNIDLSSYNNIVRLVHKSNKFSLDKMTLAKIEKISLENKNIKSYRHNLTKTISS